MTDTTYTAWPECPVCDNADEVQLAAVAVAAGREWAASRGLALRLTDPTCPNWDTSDGAMWSYRWGWFNGAVVVGLLLGGSLLLEQTLIGVILIVVTIAAGVIVSWRRLWSTREITKYNRAVAAWNKVVTPKWHDLHYCHRCDRVFTPGRQWAVSPEEWRESLGVSPQERFAQERSTLERLARED
jgi:hypothetical protein